MVREMRTLWLEKVGLDSRPLDEVTKFYLGMLGGPMTKIKGR